MHADQLDAFARSLHDSPRRRLLGLALGGGLVSLGLRDAVAKQGKGKGKHCKKCPKIDKCPQRVCCQCGSPASPTSCTLLPKNDGSCGSRCGGSFTSVGATSGFTNYCTTSNQCAQVDCPVV